MGLLAYSAVDLLFLHNQTIPLVLLIIIGAFLVNLRLISGPGYKRYPFLMNLLLGNGAVAVTLMKNQIPFIENDAYVLMAAIVLFGLAWYCLGPLYLNSRRFAFIIPLIVLSFSLGANILIPSSENIEYVDELDPLLSRINPAYIKMHGYREELIRHLQDFSGDDQLIDDLNKKISLMEEDLKRFEVLKNRNGEYEEEIRKLKERIGEISLDKKSFETVARVTSYEKAVRPSSPIVRDFAVKLASAYPGTYYRSSYNNPSPGRQGIKQIKAIHQYIASEWAYINDPLFEKSDYYSPADRTIALGLAGDCDDYAILMASCIEAIGGRARILYGTCSEGAHAWAEVYIGNQAAWNEAVAIVGKSSCLSPDGGGYWLCLDWQMGTYSCGNSPRYLYES